MSNEITTEVLAKAIDDTKDRVKEIRIGEEFKLEINQRKESFQLINKAASIQPTKCHGHRALDDQGKPDYNNVAVVRWYQFLGMKVKRL